VRASVATRALAAIAALLLIAAAACTGSAAEPEASRSAPSDATPARTAPVVVSQRVVCRIVGDMPEGDRAQVRGVDGAPSVVIGGTAYWFFGDTVRDGPAGRQDVIAASIARARGVDERGCPQLDFKQAGGTVQPMFPRHEETTAWPDGVLPVEEGSALFYMVKVTRESPFAWHVSSIGLGRFDPASMEGVRLVEAIWGEDSGFGSRLSDVRSPVRVGDNIIVYLRTEDGRNFVGKVPLARIGERDAYTYWTGTEWSPRPADAQPMWPVKPGVVPADNGISVSYDELTKQWLALYTEDLARVVARTAPQPWGPWSAPTIWIECRPLVEDVYPYCYSAEIHRELSSDPSTVYVSFSSQKPYDVTLMEVKLRAP
jgi:hypothetical protein